MGTSVITPDAGTQEESLGTAGSESLDSKIDAAFQSSSSTADGDSVSGQQDQNAGAEAVPGTEQVQDIQEQVLQDGAEIESGVTQEGKGYRVAQPRFQALRAAEKFQADVSRIAPSIEHISSWRDAASDFRAMQLNYEAGGSDPTQLGMFLDFWDGSLSSDPREQWALRQSFTRLAEQIPDRLQKVDPQAFGRLQEKFLNPDTLRESNPTAYQGLTDKIMRDAIDARYQEAVEQNDQRLFEATQWADWSLNKKFLQNMGQVPRKDPLLTERQKLEKQAAEIKAREQGLEDRTRKESTAYWSNQRSLIEQAKTVELDKLIDEVLKPAAKAYTPEQLEDFKLAIATRVNQEINKDVTFRRDHLLDLQTIERGVMENLKTNRSVKEWKPAADAYVDDYLRVAKQHVIAQAQRIVNNKTRQVVEENQQQHQRLQTSSQKRGGAGGGVQTTRKVVPDNATFEQKFDALFSNPR